MRVVVVGGTGNVGTCVLEALRKNSQVSSILALARRVPEGPGVGVEWRSADIRRDDLRPHFRGADAVVHLAWLFQPTHRPMVTWETNVEGTARVLEAVAAEDVPALVYASSVGAYSPATHDRPVTESWPTDGWPAAGYMREKAYTERLLDIFEREHPQQRVVRMRPAFTFQRDSAAQQRRLFLGPLFPNPLLRPGTIPILPIPHGLRFQAVHGEDIGRAYAAAVTTGARGAFNLAAEPVIDRTELGRLFGARTVPVPARAVRAALAVAWHTHLAPAPPDLFDALMHLPVLDTTRARTELNWQPRYDGIEALREMLAAFAAGRGGTTAPLAADTGGRLRSHEFASGVGVNE